MPTKKKRVGFIPREDVMKIIDKLSIENNLSNSKIISILVEEALSKRGLFNKRTGKLTDSNHAIKDSSLSLPENPVDFEDNETFTINTKLENHEYTGKTNLFKQTKQQTFDSQTYKKFLSFLKFQEMIDEFGN